MINVIEKIKLPWGKFAGTCVDDATATIGKGNRDIALIQGMTGLKPNQFHRVLCQNSLCNKVVEFKYLMRVDTMVVSFRRAR